jgi:hypothetical protein
MFTYREPSFIVLKIEPQRYTLLDWLIKIVVCYQSEVRVTFWYKKANLIMEL